VPDLRICGSGADLLPSLLDVLVLLRCSSVTKPLVPPGPGSTGPCTPVPILRHPVGGDVRRAAGQGGSDHLTLSPPNRPAGAKIGSARQCF
jgi:hypothetical protein